jgi:hypothetical protein
VVDFPITVSSLPGRTMVTDYDKPSNMHGNAGTPENFKTFAIPSYCGKAGKNYTGSYSGSAFIE